MREKRKIFFVLIIFLSVFIFCNEIEQIEKLILEVHFINVDQGDSIFIITPGASTMLIDSGPRNKRYKVIDYLNNLEIDKIDKIISTHPHEDHIGGMVSIFQNFLIGRVYDSGYVHNTITYNNYIQYVIRNEIDFKIAKRENKIILCDYVEVIILHPPYPMDDANNSSIVIRLIYDQFSFLFTGDAEREAEDYIIEFNQPIKSNVLKVGHHGSRTSTNIEFLRSVDPDIAVIQLGKNNRYGHPHDETLQKLIDFEVDIYRTDLHGNIVIKTDGELSYIFTEYEYEEKYISLTKEKKININTACIEDLVNIIHISEIRAKNIIELRPFSNIYELKKIDGISDIRIKDIIEQGLAYVEEEEDDFQK